MLAEALGQLVEDEEGHRFIPAAAPAAMGRDPIGRRAIAAIAAPGATSAFYLPIPPLRPLIPLLIRRIPVDIDELRGALPDRRDLELLVVDLGLLVHRAVAVLEREDLLECRLH